MSDTQQPPSQPSPNGGDKPDAFEELRKRRADESAIQQMFALSGVGFEFIAAVGGMTLLGWWLDRTFNTSPGFTLGGVALGFTVGLVILVRFGKRGTK